MNETLEFRQQKAALIDQAGALLNQAKTEKRAMTSEELAKFNDLNTQAEGMQATIDAHERHAALTTNVPTDLGERRRAGTTALQNPRQNILDKPYAHFGEQLVAIQQAELIRSSGTGREIDPRLYELQERAAAAGASEAVPADGGFLIAPDFSIEILRISHDVGMVYTKARKIPLSDQTNAIKIPGIDEQSRVDGSRWGGVRMYWENEADALIGSKPKFRLVELVMKKLTGLYYATNELLQDSRALGAIVTQAFGEEMAFKMDDGCIRGTGSGQMQGVLTSNALVTVSKETGQASATIVYENIKKMWGRMWGRSRQNAVWFINQDTEQQLYGMSQVVGTAGAPVFLPPGGASAAPYATLFARPVVPIEQCDTLGNAGDILLLDMSQFVVADKGDMQSAVSMHVRFLTDEQTFRWIYRTDGQSLWHTPLTPFKGTNTLSPFIALAAR